MGFLWTVTICWAVFIFFFQSAMNSAFLNFILLMVAIAPSGLLFCFAAPRATKRASPHESVHQAAGVSASDGLVVSEGGAGSGLNKAAKNIPSISARFVKSAAARIFIGK